MSKQVKIAIECPRCSHQYTGDFFRTIWGENEANRSMVMEDSPEYQAYQQKKKEMLEQRTIALNPNHPNPLMKPRNMV